MAEQGAGREENCEPDEQKPPLDEKAAWEASDTADRAHGARPPAGRPLQ
ncbi:hypothetical protein ACFV5M_19900 [Streptomyces albidoflavus]